MQIQWRNSLKCVSKWALVLLLLAGVSFAQEKIGAFEAAAHGQGNQLGMTMGVKATIESYSTAEDQKMLWEAFDKGGDQGLLDSLVKMPPRGHLSFIGVDEYEVVYVREIPTATGKKIRVVAKRPLAYGETRGYQTDSDYRLSALELDLGNDGKSTGTFLPACELSVDKERGIEIEAFHNPWRLDGITVHTRK